MVNLWEIKGLERYLGSWRGRNAGDSDEESDKDGRDVGEVHVAKV